MDRICYCQFVHTDLKHLFLQNVNRFYVQHKMDGKMNFSLQIANTLISVLTCSKSISDVNSMLTAVLMECQTQIGSVRSFRLCGVESLTTCLFISRLPVGMRPAAFWVNLEVSLWLAKAMCQISHIHRDIYPQKLTLAFTHQLVCKHAKKAFTVVSLYDVNRD